MSSSLEQLKAERGALAQRLSDSQRDVQQIREALKAHQDKLSLLETQKGEHAEQLTKVTQLIGDAEAKSSLVGPELTARLIGPLTQERHAVQATLQRLESELNKAHSGAAQIAQQLGPAFQKQKRFEEALSALDAMLSSSDSPAAVSASQPSPPPPAQRSMRPAEPARSPAQDPAQDPAERRPVRVPLKASINFELEVDQQSEHNFYTGFTDNISEGGLFIATDQKIDLGVEISFQLSLPTLSAPVSQRGVVRWVRYAKESSEGSPNGIGVQFIKLTPQVTAAVEAFIKRRESIFYDND